MFLWGCGTPLRADAVSPGGHPFGRDGVSLSRRSGGLGPSSAPALSRHRDAGFTGPVSHATGVGPGVTGGRAGPGGIMGLLVSGRRWSGDTGTLGGSAGTGSGGGSGVGGDADGPVDWDGGPGGRWRDGLWISGAFRPVSVGPGRISGVGSIGDGLPGDGGGDEDDRTGLVDGGSPVAFGKVPTAEAGVGMGVAGPLDIWAPGRSVVRVDRLPYGESSVACPARGEPWDMAGSSPRMALLVWTFLCRDEGYNPRLQHPPTPAVVADGWG